MKLKRNLYLSILLPLVLALLLILMTTSIYATLASALNGSFEVNYSIQYGDGTDSNPFVIYSVGPDTGIANIGTFNYLAGLNNNGVNGAGINYFTSIDPSTNDYYKFTFIQNVAIGANENLIKTDLLGTIDGNSYSFTITGESSLFNNIGSSTISSSEIKNLTIINENVASDNSVDGTTGYSLFANILYGTIDNCYAKGEVYFPSISDEESTNVIVGGFVGEIRSSGAVNNCVNEVSASGGFDSYNSSVSIGGISSTCWGNIDSCINKGEFSSVRFGAGVLSIGGIVAECKPDNISYVTNCINYADFSFQWLTTHPDGDPYSDLVIGGIVGTAYSVKMEKCVNYGSIIISGGDIFFNSCYIGGLIGSVGDRVDELNDYSFKIINCINSGLIDISIPRGLTYLGGLIGMTCHDGSSGQINDKVQNNYNIGVISTNNCDLLTTGGIIARAAEDEDDKITTYTNNYFLDNQNYSIGNPEGNNAGTKLSITQFQTFSTFSNWSDNQNIASSYSLLNATTPEPYFWVQDCAISNGTVQFYDLPRLSMEAGNGISAITYNLNGGTYSSGSFNWTFGTAFNYINGSSILTYLGDGLTKSSYVFNGWNTSADGAGANITNLNQLTQLTNGQTYSLYAEWVWEGTGTLNDPYIINSAKTFNSYAISDMGNANSYFKQICDIDFSTTPSSCSEILKGVYDGNDYSITCNGSTALFYGVEGTVKNLTVNNNAVALRSYSSEEYPIEEEGGGISYYACDSIYCGAVFSEYAGSSSQFINCVANGIFSITNVNVSFCNDTWDGVYFYPTSGQEAGGTNDYLCVGIFSSYGGGTYSNCVNNSRINICVSDNPPDDGIFYGSVTGGTGQNNDCVDNGTCNIIPTEYGSNAENGGFVGSPTDYYQG